MKTQTGFNLIELLAVLGLLALLATLAVPRLTGVQAQGEQVARSDARSAVKAAHSVAIAALKDFPTVAQLESYIDSDIGIAATARGLQFRMNDGHYVVQTFADVACSVPTEKVSDQVLCVGTIAR